MPDVARLVFGVERLDLAKRYADLLATEGVLRGLIGPREAPRLWDRHLLNCAVLSDLVPDGAAVADVGSGAGLPGLALAIARPDLRITLVEPLLRRTRFLEEACAELGLAEQVAVHRGRADELPERHSYQVVTARAVAPLERLAGWCLPLVAPGGELLAMKGASARGEAARATPELKRLGCPPPVVVELGRDILAEPTWVVRVAAPQEGQVGWRGRQAGSARRNGRPTTRRTRQRRGT